MRGIARSGSLLPVLLMFGCGGAPAPVPSDAGPPHQGLIVALPDGKGYAEILNEVTIRARGKAPKSQLIVYFLQPDMRSALAPPPTNARVVLDLPGGSKTVPLSPGPGKASDPAAAGRFASAPGEYGGGRGLSGELTAAIGGEAVTLPFQTR